MRSCRWRRNALARLSRRDPGKIMARREPRCLCGAPARMVYELPDVGRVRCVTFPRPARAGRRVPADSDAADFGRSAGAVARYPVAVRRARGPGLVRRPAAERQVDAHLGVRHLINGTRSGLHRHLETEIKFRARQQAGDVTSASRARARDDAAGRQAALRENPDVLVIDDLKTPELVAVRSSRRVGHLVIGAVTAHTTSAPSARLIERQLRTTDASGAVAGGVLARRGGSGPVAQDAAAAWPRASCLFNMRRWPRSSPKARWASSRWLSTRPQARNGADERRAAGVRTGGRGGCPRGLRKAYDRAAFLEAHEARRHRLRRSSNGWPEHYAGIRSFPPDRRK